MTTTTVRLTLIEHAVAKLVASRGVRVSALLRQARARVQAGETVPPVLHDIAALERQAAQGGLFGAMARSRLRLLEGPVPDALHTPGAVTKDAAVEGGVGNLPSSVSERSTAPIPAAAGGSVSATKATLVTRIDALLAASERS